MKSCPPTLLVVLALALGVQPACQRAVNVRLAAPADWVPSEREAPRHDCSNTEYYVPDTAHLGFWPEKVVRVNLHVVDRERDPVSADSADIGRLGDLVRSASDKLATRIPLTLPADDPPPALPRQMRYHLTWDPARGPNDHGIYFHADDEVPFHYHSGRRRNLGDDTAFRRYGYRADTILNVFLLSVDPDSARSKTYRASDGGVAIGGRYIKLVGNWRDFDNPPGARINLAHEVSHIYSLNHAWLRNDGCDDTPAHGNRCWNYNEPPGCTEVTNNLMDYSALASALTPCQIGRMHAVMAREGTQQRKFLQPNWCRGREGGDVDLRDSFVLRHAADLEGDLTLWPGAYLEVRCRLSLPAGARLRVLPGATLVLAGGKLHNSCGYTWDGVEVITRGRRRGELRYTAGSAIENVAPGRGLPAAAATPPTPSGR